jgi:hypothetical protein
MNGHRTGHVPERLRGGGTAKGRATPETTGTEADDRVITTQRRKELEKNIECPSKAISEPVKSCARNAFSLNIL